MLLFVDIRRGGASSQTEIGEEENSSENTENSGESDKNVDNSGDLSTSGENSGNDSKSTDSGESGESADSNDGNVEVKATSIDLGYYDGLTDDDGNEVVWWISDTSYFCIDWYDEAEGTESDPYIIDSAEDLAGLSYLVFTGNYKFYGQYVVQTCDLDLSGTQYKSGGLYWMPIGGRDEYGVYGDTSGKTCHFGGDYDGGGHKIYGATIFFSSDVEDLTIFTATGIFGNVQGVEATRAAIHGIRLEDSVISGNAFVGGIVGYTYIYSSIYDCTNDATVSGVNQVGGIVGICLTSAVYVWDCVNTGSVIVDGSIVGGVVGKSAGTISGCSNSGAISGPMYVGGIAGIVDGAYVHDCYNLGSVSAGVHSAGGVCGELYNEVIVSNCYSTATISGGYYVGGIVGLVQLSSIFNCFAFDSTISASRSSSYETVGAIVGGVTLSDSTIANCYYGDCTILGYVTYYQKGIGWDASTDVEGEDQTGVVESLSNISSYAKIQGWFTSDELWNLEYAWDFDDVWGIRSDNNNGYPILKCMLASFLQYDSAGGYWFYEDGLFPQSAVTDADLIDELEADADVGYDTYVLGSEKFSVWTYDGQEYVKVTAAGKNGTASDSGCTWFLVEPIVWIVAYGTADEEPTDLSTAVSALVLTVGAYTGTTGDLTFRSLFTGTSENAAVAVASGDLILSTVDTIVYDAFNTTASQTVVFSVNLDNVTSTSGNTTVTSAGYRVASVNEIDALGGAYATECSDLVAFLLSGGSSASGETYGAAAYWTRDLAYELGSDSYYGTAHGGKAYSYDGTYNQGIYITSDGIISNATLKNVFGARLSVSV